jgi:RNA polymerase sigma-70 factor (ECF subfamily)
VDGVLGAEFTSRLAAARRGDEAGFTPLWRDLQPPLLRYLGVAAGAAAEDLASETWARVVQDLARFEGDEAGFRAWVFTIARHRLLDWRRREARTRAAPRPNDQLSHLGAADDPATDALERVSTDEALALIARLPADQAEVVMLRAVAGLDVARVATLVGKRPGAVRVLTHRGLRRLAELLAVDSPHDDPSPGVVTP